MPVYQFECKKHGRFEKITIRAEWEDIRCPDCGFRPKLPKMNQRKQKKDFERFLGYWSFSS